MRGEEGGGIAGEAGGITRSSFIVRASTSKMSSETTGGCETKHIKGRGARSDEHGRGSHHAARVPRMKQ